MIIDFSEDELDQIEIALSFSDPATMSYCGWSNLLVKLRELRKSTPINISIGDQLHLKEKLGP